jgi:small-conductance mechanosensitive channel
MDNLIEVAKETPKNTFFNHVFSTTEDGKAEILNVVQYVILAVIPVLLLNKTIQRFIPEADPDKSSLEIVIEILIQLIIIVIGIVLIHRIITYIPTYSGFKYEHLTLTSVIVAFLIIVLSIQTKLGIKANILVDRLGELWNGPSSEYKQKQGVRLKQPANRHVPSQADYVDNSQIQNDMFPPAPMATTKHNESYDNMIRGSAQPEYVTNMGPLPANSIIGGSFGSSF